MVNDPSTAKITIIMDLDGRRTTRTYETARNVHSEENYNYAGSFLNPREFLSSAEVSLRFRAIADIPTGIWQTAEFSNLDENGVDDRFEAGKWWRAIDADGDMMAETSNVEDFVNLGLTEIPGMTYQRLYTEVKNQWVDSVPTFRDRNK